MFKINQVTRTKNGELVKPFAVQGTLVLCFDKDGNTIKRALTDFDFSVPKEKEVVSVIPSKNTVKPQEEPEQDKEPEPEEDKEPEPEEDTTNSSGSIWDDVDDGYI